MGVLLNTLIPRRATESRATFKDNTGWLADWVRGGYESASGEHVNPTSALGIPVYFDCLRVLSEDLAKMALPVLKDNGAAGREKVENHPVGNLLNRQANPYMTAMRFRETLFGHALGYKGGFAEIVRNAERDAVTMWPIDPNTVRIDDTKGSIQFWVRDERRNVEVLIPYENMFHIHGFGHDGITGYCLSAIARDSLGLALAAQRSGASFFKNGAVGTGHIEVPGPVKTENLKILREQFSERHTGSANMWKPIILEHGAKWVQDSFDPEKSQFIETLLHSDENVCRLFRMPPHKVGILTHATYSNIEHSNRQYADETLSPWTVRFEQEADIKLFRPKTRGLLYVRHNFMSLMKGDSASRGALYTVMFGLGALNPNEVRALEDMNPLGPEGNEYYISQNLLPVRVALNAATANTDMTPQEQDKQVESVGEAIASLQIEYKEYIPLNSAIDRMVDSYHSLLEATYARVLRNEYDKVERAKSRGNYEQWAKTFYAGNVSFVQAALGDVVNAILKSVLAVSHPGKTIQSEKIQLISYALADRHNARSIKSDDWKPDARAIADAVTETEFIKEKLKGAMV